MSEYRTYRSERGDMMLRGVPAFLERIGNTIEDENGKCLVERTACTVYEDEEGNCVLTLPPGGEWIDDAMSPVGDKQNDHRPDHSNAGG